VGADSATAAILAAGLGTAAIAGVTPNSAEWLAYTSFIALICGGLLLIARCSGWDSWATSCPHRC
jgi:hypothetical protein